MTETASLIARLEKATGPDRELDILIGKATSVEGWRVCDDGSVECYVPDGHEFGEGWIFTGQELPAYTSSIDAAMTLVPERRAIRREWLPAGSWPARCYIHKNDTVPIHDDEFSFKGRGKTEAISICIAALKARSPS